QLTAGRLRRGFEHLAFNVIFPAVVNAAQAALFVAAEKQRSAAMGAMLAEQADASGAVAKGDQILAEQAHAHRRAVRLGNLLGEQRGNPVAAEELARGAAGMNAGQEIVVLF